MAEVRVDSSETGVTPSPRDSMREAILSGARSCILRYGIAKTTMDDIAKEAGYSRPTVYRYFNDRTELVTALVDVRAREVLEETQQFLARDGNDWTFADKVTAGLLHVVINARHDPIVAIALNPGNQEDASWLKTLELAESLTAALWDGFFKAAQAAGEMRSGLDDSDLYTWLAMTQLDLFNLMKFKDSDDQRYETFIRQFILPALLP
ncbi:TetR/AcrR family transcriptional regulator [Gordonia sp. KTR9]|uniref:TetR/AcrR family transcriptional regulator n=1 Tax=Gordonia sp. KTR9 TaxID=337191 RepID=UPI00027DDC0E|nr:TetR/AcrR family transcriptional regulator [Gordonia sp. KTR9]AFR48193.1 Transcriptional regulator [Gordonia sp. KTR9]